ncbi:hypothetical protein SAMN06296378_1448 [Salinibacterium xinjiangense]|uniref:Uncharacterized protein n=1 Tax=Salinibacterium xinjiangense TaxID=386302 RepID=A0A2C8ZJ92_9MICO|nr:hypothetical protein [Salinibacterium xinjiangense]SOE64801.1 hypothetical protein SAMN06296378_1448 [Salinibacterium xinjiangense]
MIIVMWRRWGPLGLVFLVFGFLVWVGVSALLRQQLHTTSVTGWWDVGALVFGFGIGAIANWFFAVMVVEPKLDRPNAFPKVASSTLFFLPLRHWSLAIVAVGVVFLIPNLIEVISG